MKDIESVNKIQRYIFSKVNINNKNKHNANSYIVSFPLKELVSSGIYTDLVKARKGFINTVKLLKALEISEYDREGEYNKLYVMVTVTKKECAVALNPFLNWEKYALNNYEDLIYKKGVNNEK